MTKKYTIYLILFKISQSENLSYFPEKWLLNSQNESKT